MIAVIVYARRYGNAIYLQRNCAADTIYHEDQGKMASVEQNIREAVAMIRNLYVDEKLAHRMADEIDLFLKSPVGKKRISCDDMGSLLFDLNAIVTSIAHDMHLGFGRATQSPNRAGSGIIRTGPHYVQIQTMDNISNPEIRKQYIAMIAQLADPVIFDLRGCNGGDADALYFLLCPFFADGTPLFTMRTRMNPPRVFRVASKVPMFATENIPGKYTGSMKVLVNAYTYSGGEIFSKTIQANGRAKIYGTTTAGAFHVTRKFVFGSLSLFLPYASLIDFATKQDSENIGVIPDYTPTSREYISTIFTTIADNSFVGGK